MSARGCSGITVQRNKGGSCAQTPDSGSNFATLAAIVRDYLLYFQPEHERELMWFRGQPSLDDALRFAVLAQDEHGHRYSHQRRIKAEAIAKASRALADVHDDLGNCTSFHELWSLIGRCLRSTKGIRELYVYDCASRLGAHLRLEPDRNYLHAGTREGAANLGLLSSTGARKQWLESAELPRTLRRLPPSDVENLLCIYKEELKEFRRGD